ncbi:MAG: serine hydrolase domain-containing protein [Rhizomicrobium sp.]
MRGLLSGAVLSLLASQARADPAGEARFDAIVRPTGFSGAILVRKDDVLLFDKAYGLADATTGKPNRPSTSFHVGTLSMRYTAVAILHLAETHKLSLDNLAGQFVTGLEPPLANATIRALAALPPDAPQAAAAYETLAKVAAADTGKTFEEVTDAAAFGTVWMAGSGLDDGSHAGESRMAKGYSHTEEAPVTADWAALTGAASAFTTTRDELHWLDMVFGDGLLTAQSRAMLAAAPAGYGWSHGARYGGDAWWASGSAPGFASYVMHVPATGLTVIVLGNSDLPVAGLGDALAAEAVAGSGR